MVKALPYIPWDDDLVTKFFDILQFKKNQLPTDELKSRFACYIDYLESTYFTTGPFSFRNQETFIYFANGADDLTSNAVESINYKLNSLFHNSSKTVAYVCAVLYKF